MVGEAELKRIADTALSASMAEQTEVLVLSTHSALTRFANNYIHQNVEQQDTDVRIRVVSGRKIGVAGTNDTSDDALRRAVERATEMARHQKPNEDFRSLPGPRPIASANAWSEATARCGPEERAHVAGLICGAAVKAGLIAAGAFRTAAAEMAVANSLGVWAYHRDTMAGVNTVIMGETSSGHAERVAMDVGEIDGDAVSREAVDRALRSADPVAVEPGDYEVVFLPYAVADILDFFAYLSFGAQAFQEKRSFMSGRIGERVMGENITIWDDGLSPDTIAQPFDFEGVPKQPVTFIEDGIARGVVWDSYTAGKEGRESTGHALPAGNTFGPVPSNMLLRPGAATLDDMIADVKRGILVSRFWYTRPVHPLNVIITGMTRDGTFLIENGKITKPVKNLRFTQGYVEALNNVDLIGRDTMLCQAIAGVSRVPALKIRKWSFTGATQF